VKGGEYEARLEIQKEIEKLMNLKMRMMQFTSILNQIQT
jgi:hypothetical protein